MNVLDTEQPQYHLVCNTDKTQRVQVSREEQDWQKNNTFGALLGKSKMYVARCNYQILHFGECLVCS